LLKSNLICCNGRRNKRSKIKRRLRLTQLQQIRYPEVDLDTLR
jgi:hypothetical protein